MLEHLTVVFLGGKEGRGLDCDWPGSQDGEEVVIVDRVAPAFSTSFALI